MPDEITFGWNPIAGRFYSLATGRFISFQLIRDEGIEALVMDTKAQMGTLTDQLIAHEISLAEWQGSMMELIKDGNNLSAIAARGGFEQMSQADWGAVGRATRDQYEYLRNFAEQIASGEQPLNGSARVRAQLYAEAIENQFERFRRRNVRIYHGAEEERRLLDPDAEHCDTRDELTGCVDIADFGWQIIGSLPPIGQSPCIVRCRCRFVFRKKVGDQWIEVGE